MLRKVKNIQNHILVVWLLGLCVGAYDELKTLWVTREAMYLGIEQAVVGNRIGDIGAAIQEYAESVEAMVSFVIW